MAITTKSSMSVKPALGPDPALRDMEDSSGKKTEDAPSEHDISLKVNNPDGFRHRAPKEFVMQFIEPGNDEESTAHFSSTVQ
jgi:hypothetical protein